MVEPPREQPKSLDVQCLKCGAMNIPENHVCGRCGANLPLVYDEEGRVFNRRESIRSPGILRRGARQGLSPYSARWLLRAGVLIFAVLAALWIMARK